MSNYIAYELVGNRPGIFPQDADSTQLGQGYSVALRPPLRENHELRSNQRYLTRNGAAASERRAPVRVDVTYLVTAWTTDVSDEHQLLGQLLTTLLRYPLLPDETLKGAMQTQPLPLQAWIAQPERTPNAWDFWAAWTGDLRPESATW